MPRHCDYGDATPPGSDAEDEHLTGTDDRETFKRSERRKVNIKQLRASYLNEMRRAGMRRNMSADAEIEMLQRDVEKYYASSKKGVQRVGKHDGVYAKSDGRCVQLTQVGIWGSVPEPALNGIFDNFYRMHLDRFHQPFAADWVRTVTPPTDIKHYHTPDAEMHDIQVHSASVMPHLREVLCRNGVRYMCHNHIDKSSENMLASIEYLFVLMPTGDPTTLPNVPMNLVKAHDIDVQVYLDDCRVMMHLCTKCRRGYDSLREFDEKQDKFKPRIKCGHVCSVDV